MKKLILHILVLGLLTIVSCDDNDFYKVPTDLKVTFAIEPEAEANPSFNGGFVILSSFEFRGERLVGDDIEFELEFENGKTFVLDTAGVQDFITLDIPQGEYHSIELEFETYTEDDIINLMTRGVYSKMDQSVVAVIFEFNDSETFVVKGESDDDNADIILTENLEKIAKTIFDPNHWFSVVPTSMMEEAETELRNGVETIVVNEKTNEDIYSIVINRLDESMDAIFGKD